MKKKIAALLTAAMLMIGAVAAVNLLEREIPGEYNISLVGDIGIYGRVGDITYFDQPISYFNLTAGQIVFSMVNEGSNTANFTIEVQDPNNVAMIFLWDPEGWTAGGYPIEGIELFPDELVFLSCELGDTSLAPQGSYAFNIIFRAE